MGAELGLLGEAEEREAEAGTRQVEQRAAAAELAAGREAAPDEGGGERVERAEAERDPVGRAAELDAGEIAHERVQQRDGREDHECDDGVGARDVDDAGRRAAGGHGGAGRGDGGARNAAGGKRRRGGRAGVIARQRRR